MATPGSWHAFSYGGMTYDLLLPDNYTPTQKYPVLLFEHGGGEESQMPGMIDPWFNNAQFRSSYPAILVAPILPNSSATVTWGAYPADGSANSAGENQALAILQQVLSQYAADRNRVYVTGLSLGGHGSWDLMLKYNGYNGPDGRIFAAGLPLAGSIGYASVADSPSAAQLAELRGVPVWAINGNDGAQGWSEAVANVLGTQSAFRLTDNGALGHDVWDTYYPLPAGQPYYDWLFSQAAHLAPPSADEIAAALPSGRYNITPLSDGTAVVDTANGATVAMLPPVATDTLQFISIGGIDYGLTLVSARELGMDTTALRDFDGNDLGNDSQWQLKGLASVRAGAMPSYILVNPANGRWAEVATQPDGSFNFANHGANGDTRIVGIYIDPLVQAGLDAAGGPFDSQTRFLADVRADRLAVLGSMTDPSQASMQDLFFKLTNHAADHHDDVYLRAILWPDGNIQYANYIDTGQLTAFMTSAHVPNATYAAWLTHI